MAMKHHPDKGGDPEQFKAIQEAFEVLNDPQKRQQYDELGEEALKEDGPTSPSDIFEQLFGGGGAGGGPSRRTQRPRTKDIVRPVWLTLEELYSSVTRPLPITRKVIDSEDASQPCPACGGQGVVIQVIRMGPMIQQVQQKCPNCGGAGQSAKMISKKEVLEVFVEKGSPDGHKIVFHGKADESSGCEPGDVIAVVKQQEHREFMRKGADLYIERDISLAEALTGFRIAVQHLDGRTLVVCSKPGEVLQPQRSGMALKAVTGGGMPIHQDPFNFGNLFLVFRIIFPQLIEPSICNELRALLGSGEHSGVSDALDELDDAEHVFVEDLDPLESSKRGARCGNEAYEEDVGQGMQRVECKQQ